MVERRIRRQVAALPYRIAGRGTVEVMLITSRETGRWVIPKGWPIKGRKPFEAAAREAWEEAGVVGKIDKILIGHFEYDKVLPNRAPIRCCVDVYMLSVHIEDVIWPEFKERERRWFSATEASLLVQEPGLADIITTFEKAARVGFPESVLSGPLALSHV